MRTTWMLDGAYLFAAPTGSGRIDYLKLKRLLEGENGGPFNDTYYLNATPNPPRDQKDAFHTWLKAAPPHGPHMTVQLYALKTIRTTCASCGTPGTRLVQKGVDVGIATLSIRLAVQERYDRLILCAGDGDFKDALGYVKDLGKEIWLAGFNRTISADLQALAARVIWLDQLWESIRRDHPRQNAVRPQPLGQGLS